MPLDRLAPDQRAVVQLVLQQGRSYEDLARLLGISDDAVRERARAGLLALGADLTAPPEAGEIADFLLGQQTVSQRESTRQALAFSPAANAWARAVAEDLVDVAGEDLPEIPPSTAAPEPEPEPEPEPLPDLEPLPEEPEEAEEEADEGEEELEPLPARGRPTPLVTTPRPRPRPLREGAAAPRPIGRAPEERPSSKLGGALLIGGLGILIAAILLFVLTGNDDDEGADRVAQSTPTAQGSPTASGSPEALGQIQLRAVGGSRAAGAVTFFRGDQGVIFQLQAEQVPALKDGQAYAVWLTRKRGSARRLGYFNEAPAPETGQLAITGPREEDSPKFLDWITRDYDFIVVSRESVEEARKPGPIVLRGPLPKPE